LQAYIFIKDMNPEDMPEGVDVMYEPNWNTHTIHWHLQNAEEQFKTVGSEEIAVKLTEGKQSVHSS
jgi:hypothetical protein